MRKIRTLLSSEAEKAFKELNFKAKNSKIEASLLKSIQNKIELIKINPQYGNPIEKRKIPKIYKEKYKITNLFRLELTNFWRMDYTLRNNEIEIIAFVLNIMDHDKYNKIYGYKKK
jgi:hypothetical protein